jgi:hypothetical protein
LTAIRVRSSDGLTTVEYRLNEKGNLERPVPRQKRRIVVRVADMDLKQYGTIEQHDVDVLDHQGLMYQHRVVGTVPFVILPAFGTFLISSDKHWNNIGGVYVECAGVERDMMFTGQIEAEDMLNPFDYGVSGETMMDQRTVWSVCDVGDYCESLPVSHEHSIPIFQPQ